MFENDPPKPYIYIRLPPIDYALFYRLRFGGISERKLQYISGNSIMGCGPSKKSVERRQELAARTELLRVRDANDAANDAEGWNAPALSFAELWRRLDELDERAALVEARVDAYEKLYALIDKVNAKNKAEQELLRLRLKLEPKNA